MKRFSMRLAGSAVWFAPGLTHGRPPTKKGPRHLRNPLKALGAGGRNRTVDLLITNQMGRQDNMLIPLEMFLAACTLPAAQ